MSHSFEFTGPPLTEIETGLYDLHMRDGAVVLAVVDRSDGEPCWSPIGEFGASSEYSDDWSDVTGAVMVSLVEAARRVPSLTLPEWFLGYRP